MYKHWATKTEDSSEVGRSNFPMSQLSSHPRAFRTYSHSLTPFFHRYFIPFFTQIGIHTNVKSHTQPTSPHSQTLFLIQETSTHTHSAINLPTHLPSRLNQIKHPSSSSTDLTSRRPRPARHAACFIIRYPQRPFTLLERHFTPGWPHPKTTFISNRVVVSRARKRNRVLF